eukprot:12406928-Karenia_brevis.AAC.1
MFHLIPDTQQHVFTSSIRITHTKSKNYSQLSTNTTGYTKTISGTKPTHQYYHNKQLYLFYTSPNVAHT